MPLTLRLLLVLWTVSIDGGGVSANVPMLKYRLMSSATFSFLCCSFFASKIHFRDCLSKQRVYSAALFLSSAANKVFSERYLLSTRNNVAKVFRFFIRQMSSLSVGIILPLAQMSAIFAFYTRSWAFRLLKLTMNTLRPPPKWQSLQQKTDCQKGLPLWLFFFLSHHLWLEYRPA